MFQRMSSLSLAVGLSALLTATPAHSTSQGTETTTPATETQTPTADALFAQLAMATSERDAWPLEQAIWMHWMVAPSPEAQGQLDKAMQRRGVYDFAGAVAVLDGLVKDTPDYAEGWNQRATVKFMQEDYDGSLDDIEETLAREPRHFGALAGKAVILMRQGRVKLGQKALKRALKIHPWLRERGLLIKIPEREI